jgi:colanic acid biosynthesis glycosyl transferase WcaI
MRIVVICPHFAPDTAPTGTVMTRIVTELAGRGHELHVVTSLPWYRRHAVEDGWRGRLVRRERTEWGSISRIHPFPAADKANLLRRALAFIAFSLIALPVALTAGGRPRRIDAVLSMSPPLTLGGVGALVARARSGRAVFNIQDVFPDAAVRTGAITNRRIIALAERLERLTYRLSDAVTVLSGDLLDNLTAKVPADRREDLQVITNFVDTELITPGPSDNDYRREHGLTGIVAMYAGNVGFSQSLDTVVEAARRLPDITFVINGDGAARERLERDASELANLALIGYQPAERLPEVLAAADIHLVPLRAGLGSVSVPSKTYTALAAARPVIAAVDPGTAIAQLIGDAGCGLAVAPDDADALVAAIEELAADPERCRRLGEAGRAWVVDHASPAAVGEAYEQVLSGRPVNTRSSR